MFPPERIVCLTEETVETLYLLGEQDRIVGISGYCVRPPEARRDKPRISAFTSADIPKIIDLKPDLVLSFSDLQADIVAALIRHGVAVHAFNQRTVAEILDMIRMLGVMVGAGDRADRLAEELAAGLDEARSRAMPLPRRPRVYFEEWDDPMISGIAWVSELISATGGIDIFAGRAGGKSAKERIVTAPEVVARMPDIIIGSWCGKKFRPEKVMRTARFRFDPGRPERRHSRNQVAADPATGSSSVDGRAHRASAIDRSGRPWLIRWHISRHRSRFSESNEGTRHGRDQPRKAAAAVGKGHVEGYGCA